MNKAQMLTNNCATCNLKFAGFDTMDNEQLSVFKESHCRVEYKKGETIIKQGARCSNLVCIKSGYVKMHVEGLGGRSVIIKVLKPGDFIISPGIFDDNRNHFSASAITDVNTCLISIDAFSKVFHTNHKFAESILKHNHQLMQALYHQLINLSHKKMTGRVADTLLYLSGEVYQSNVFYTTLSRQDMADLSSVSKESLIRILKDFKESGIILVEGNQFKIQASTTLQKISQAG
ncbi:Crp/Fnr family transcriptional regulator [Carboxylicivirga linearis]|uniref:Crp/Fnr family transcriptional regulator n=1 Tax=Carboxylicivirga linearis TaxID=1628157 RepID=A0ABS5JYN1_9BACT|nr:Crp/Fnr family transcriptional regulator [Carboxylicivirga linearis]MBS2099905.1 Crp/Fnr family transcriptional regulator [Carboxylicivirga linearis]